MTYLIVRPGNFLALHKKNEYGKQANKTPVKSTTGPKFLPNLVVRIY